MKVGSNARRLADRLEEVEGQAIAEYATMLAIILVLVIGTIVLMETKALQLLIGIAQAFK